MHSFLSVTPLHFKIICHMFIVTTAEYLYQITAFLTINYRMLVKIQQRVPVDWSIEMHFLMPLTYKNREPLRLNTVLRNDYAHDIHFIVFCSGPFYWFHDDVIKWKHFPRHWPFVRGIHRWPVNFPRKGNVFFDLHLNSWANHRDAGSSRRHRIHYDVTVMQPIID